MAVVLRVNIDTDEVVVSLEMFAGEGAGWEALAQLQETVGRELGWCWTGKNSQGYFDTFLIALDGIDPLYSFTGAASLLTCSRVTPIAA